jgi:signal transduction histidine kinase
VGAALLCLRELGWWFSDAIAWPAVLIAGGGALLWRAAQLAADRVVAPPAPAPATPVEARAARAAAARARALLAGGGGLGLVMVLGAGVVFLWLTGALGVARDALLPAATLLVVLAVVGAPLWVRLVRALASERDGRIRSQERAELAAHVHDSVLQTLALVQQRADDPRAVVSLARRQERELRGWLNGDGRTGPDRDARLSAALEDVADEVEADHGVPVEVVAVGDAELDDRGRALVAATREAVVNAARHAGGDISVYIELAPERAEVFVRDRGDGFDLDGVPAGRLGVRESIIGRMQRAGGTAIVRSGETGTEIQLRWPDQEGRRP